MGIGSFGGVFLWKGWRRVSEMKFFMYIEIMCVFWCFFMLIVNYIYVFGCYVYCILRIGCFFCFGLFFNGIRNGCCFDVNCICV